MRKCVMCQKRKVKEYYDFFCPECYSGEFEKEIKQSLKILRVLHKYGLREILWRVIWLLNMIHLSRREEYRNQEEENHTIGFCEPVMTKTGKDTISYILGEENVQ